MSKVRFLFVTTSILVLLLVVPFQLDKSTLPFGWDIPKTRFVQWWSITVIIIQLLILVFSILYKVLFKVKLHNQIAKRVSKIKSQNSKNFKSGTILAINRLRTKQFKITPFYFIIPISLFIISVGSIYSKYKSKFDLGEKSFGSKFPEYNKLYELLDFLPDKQAIFGNIFREQGLLTYLLLISAFIVLTYNLRFINKKFLTIVILSLLTILITSLINSVEAIRQTSVYLIEDPSKITEGRWIFGYFGQANFYVGAQIVGILSGMQLFKLIEYSKLKRSQPIHNSYEIALKAILLVCIFIIIISTIPTFSIYGIAVLFFSILLFFSQFIFKTQNNRNHYSIKLKNKWRIFTNKHFIHLTHEIKAIMDEEVYKSLKLFLIRLQNYPLRARISNIKFISVCLVVLILSIILISPLLNLSSKNFPDQRHRLNIWDGVYEVSINNPIKNNQYDEILFGHGFDNLGEVFRENGILQQSYVDRAHNILLDILATTGIIGLTIFIGLIFLSYKTLLRNFNKTQRQIEKSIYNFIAILISALLIRSLIHTDSIVSIVYLALVLSFIFSNRNDSKERH